MADYRTLLRRNAVPPGIYPISSCIPVHPYFDFADAQTTQQFYKRFSKVLDEPKSALFLSPGQTNYVPYIFLFRFFDNDCDIHMCDTDSL